MSSPTNTIPLGIERVGIRALESAFMRVLGSDFEGAIRQLVEANNWYHEISDVSELFRLWVCDNIHRPDDPQWIFQPIRVTERKFLCEELGIDRSTIVGLSPSVLANRLLATLGLPNEVPRGRAAVLAEWKQIGSWIEEGQDDRAASVARQSAERYLRLLLYFYCYCGLAPVLVEIVRSPGSLRIPNRLKESSDGEPDDLLAVLQQDDWADLGFLSIALPKFSSRVADQPEKALLDREGEIFGESHSNSFIALSHALQPYAHDRPSSAGRRRQEFEHAAKGVLQAINDLSEKNIFPDQLVVLETCTSVVGNVFRGIDETKAVRHLAADSVPPLGRRIWFVGNAKRDFAKCVWSPVPWN